MFLNTNSNIPWRPEQFTITAKSGYIINREQADYFKRVLLAITSMYSDIANAMNANWNYMTTYGEMYATNISKTVTVGAINTAYEVDSGLVQGELSNTSFGDDHYIQVSIPGKYLINWSMAIDTATAGDEIEGGVMLNGTASEKGTSHTSVSASSNGSTIAASLISDLAAGDQVSLYVRNHTGTHDIVMEHASLTMKMVNQ